MSNKAIIASLAAFALWGCSQALEEPGRTNPDPDPVAGEAFLGITLGEAGTSTRADGTHREYDDTYEHFEWFNKGTADERAVIDNPESNRVLFFGSDGAWLGSARLKKPSVSTVSSDVYVARRPAETGFSLPAYALVVLNGDPARLDALDGDLAKAGVAAVKTVLGYLNEVDTDDPESLAMYDGYFTMSSAVWRAEDSDEIAVLTPLDPDGPVFYETEEEAVLPEHLTTFYVERLLAKFTLVFSDPDEGNKRFSEYKGRFLVKGSNQLKVRRYYLAPAGASRDVMTGWRVNIVNWGLNGLEKDTYLLKNLVAEPGAGYPAGWKIPGNFYVGWNAPTLKRSYWALDPNYSGGSYPEQYRLALDVDGVKAATTNTIYSDDWSESAGLKKDEYTLIYKPYNAFTDISDNKYSLENTFDAAVLSEQDVNTQPWLRSGTHILLTAQLLFDEFDKDVDLTGTEPGFIGASGTKVTDKYFSNGLWWTGEALKQQAVATLMTNLYYNKKGDDYRIRNVLGTGYVDFINTDEHMLNDDVPVAVIENGQVKPLRHEDLPEIADKYFTFAPAFIKGGDGWVTLKKKDGVDLYAYYTRYEEGGRQVDYIQEGKPLSDEQLAAYIYRFTNLAKHFSEGRMYYAVPIRHNLESNSFENSPVTRVRTGDYGVVRNSWYRLTITSIERPGTPVDDPDQPIIPNPEPDDRSLGVEVEVIPWHVRNIAVGNLH